VRLTTQRLVQRFLWTLTLIAAALLWAADPAAGQTAAPKGVHRPRPTSRFKHVAANQAVVGGDWDFFITGTNLNFRRGSAKMTEKFQSIALPSAGQKLSADSQNVYVWLDDQHVMSYAIGDQGPASSGVARSGDDVAAAEALRHPYVSPTRLHVQAITPATVQTISPQRLYVANSGLDSVSVIDTSANAIIGTIALIPGANPQDVEVAPNNLVAFTADAGNGSGCTTCTNLGVQSFDPLALTTAGNTLPATDPFALVYSPDATTIFVADDLNIDSFSTSTGVSQGTNQSSAFSWALVQTPDGTTLYSLDDDDVDYQYGYTPYNAITVFTTPGLGTATHYLIPAGTYTGEGLGCYGMALSPVNGNLYVACNWELYGSSATPAVYEISISGGNITILNTFYTSGAPEAVAFSPDGSKLYVALDNANSVIVMDPNFGTQLAAIPVGSEPASITVNSSGTLGYVANFGSGTVTVLNLTTNAVVTTIVLPTGAAPAAVSLSYAAAGSSIGTVAATVNGASFASGAPVAVGALVSLFGTGIGPANAAAATSLPLPTTLGGYQVKIGGIYAPLLYLSSGQINCQVPFELAGTTSAQVTVTNGTATSSPSTVTLAASAPGIFVGSGTQGAVLNQDYSANSAANPAARGAVVQIFATGQGLVTNQPLDGVGAPSSPVATTPATTPVVVIIGGYVATVQFSGLAPGFVGLWQVNATVPSTVTPGGAVTLQIIINGQSSNTVTIGVQ
jgi:uncharacterized protein (TIGR03437 family)